MPWAGLGDMVADVDGGTWAVDAVAVAVVVARMVAPEAALKEADVDGTEAVVGAAEHRAVPMAAQGQKADIGGKDAAVVGDAAAVVGGDAAVVGDDAAVVDAVVDAAAVAVAVAVPAHQELGHQALVLAGMVPECRDQR